MKKLSAEVKQTMEAMAEDIKRNLEDFCYTAKNPDSMEKFANLVLHFMAVEKKRSAVRKATGILSAYADISKTFVESWEGQPETVRKGYLESIPKGDERQSFNDCLAEMRTMEEVATASALDVQEKDDQIAHLIACVLCDCKVSKNVLSGSAEGAIKNLYNNIIAFKNTLSDCEIGSDGDIIFTAEAKSSCKVIQTSLKVVMDLTIGTKGDDSGSLYKSDLFQPKLFSCKSKEAWKAIHLLGGKLVVVNSEGKRTIQNKNTSFSAFRSSILKLVYAVLMGQDIRDVVV